MQYDSSQIASRMNEQIDVLLAKHEEHLAAAAEIETQVNRALQMIGLEPIDFGARSGVGPRLPRPTPQQHPLTPGTMGAHMMDLLLKADKGYSRRELRNELEKVPQFAEQLTGNVNSYYNTVKRYLDRGRIVDVDGLIYHPDRAPLPDGEEDPTGQHLPSNVSSLFPAGKRAINLDD